VSEDQNKEQEHSAVEVRPRLRIKLFIVFKRLYGVKDPNRRNVEFLAAFLTKTEADALCARVAGTFIQKVFACKWGNPDGSLPSTRLTIETSQGKQRRSRSTPPET
jgi:hypothetical protein